MKVFNFFILLLTFIDLNAQNEIKLINSMDLLKEGVKFYDAKDYEKAIEKYSQVEKNDTNFLMAQYEIALAYNAMEEYDKCIEICQDFIANKNNHGDANENQVYNLLGSSLDHNKKTEQSLAAYDMGISKYPYFTSYQLNKAVTYKNAKEYDKSIEQYKTTLASNPYYSNAHYHLGVLAFNEEKYTQGLLAITMSALISGNSSVLYYLDNFAAMNITVEPKNIALNSSKNMDDFEELDLILKNKIALNKKYKTSSSFTYPFVKQLYTIIENLEYNKDDKGYWMQNYVPYFIALKNDNQFENMIYYLVSMSADEKISDQVKKKMPEMKAFYQWHNNKWNELQCRTEMTINGKKETYNRWFYNQVAQAAGNKNAEGKNIGPWEFYNENGKFKSSGNYDNNGQRNQYWKFYNDNGTIGSEYNYTADKFDGEYKLYDNFGILKETGTYKNGERDGIMQTYYKDGTPKSKFKYKDGKIDGASEEYYPNGQIEYLINYNAENKIEGDISTFFPEGTKKSDMKWEDGERDGITKFYYINGQLASNYNFKEGKLDGAYETYYINGQLKEKGTYLMDKSIGEYVSYFMNGKLENKYVFDENGKKNGIIENYSIEGFKYIEQTNVKGDIQSVKHFDKDGKLLREIETKKGKINFISIADNGNIISEGTIENGKSIGLWKFFDDNGSLKSEEDFENDELNGTDKNYYMNGEIMSQLEYKDGERNGYYESFYSDGIKEEEGNYLAGNLEGKWKEYYENGNLKSINYYLNNESDGYQEEYDLNGKLSNVLYYKNETLIEVYKFDTSENIIDTAFFNYGNANIELKTSFDDISRKGSYKNGKAYGNHKFYEGKNVLLTEGNYLNGLKHGQWKWYEFGKLESEGNYVNGQINGEYNSYYPSGKLKSVYYYINDIDTGVWKYYYENGQLERTSPYQNNGRDGASYYYAANGDLQFVKYHKNNYLIGYSYNGTDGKLKEMIPLNNETGKIETYFSNGKKSAEINVLKGYHDKECKKYYSSGQLESVENHENGKDHGAFTFYYPDGKIKEEGNHHFGNFNGKRTTYFSNGNKKQEMNYKFGILYGPVTFYKENGQKTKIINYYQDQIIDEENF